MKKKKWIRISVFATCYFIGMMIYPFVTGEKIHNWPAWMVIWTVFSVLVAAVDELLRNLYKKRKQANLKG